MYRYYLIYDDKCDLCLKAVKRTKQLVGMNQIQLVPLSRSQLPDKFILPPKSQLIKKMHLFCPDGSVLLGSEAVAQIYLLSESNKKFGLFLKLPVIRTISKIIYSLIARFRTQFPPDKKSGNQ